MTFATFSFSNNLLSIFSIFLQKYLVSEFSKTRFLKVSTRQMTVYHEAKQIFQSNFFTFSSL